MMHKLGLSGAALITLIGTFMLYADTTGLPDLESIRRPVDDSAFIAATAFIVVGTLFTILFWLLRQRAKDWTDTKETLFEVIKQNTTTNVELNKAIVRLSDKIDEEKRNSESIAALLASHPCLLLSTRKYRDAILDLIDKQEVCSEIPAKGSVV